MTRSHLYDPPHFRSQLHVTIVAILPPPPWERVMSSNTPHRLRPLLRVVQLIPTLIKATTPTCSFQIAWNETESIVAQRKLLEKASLVLVHRCGPARRPWATVTPKLWQDLLDIVANVAACHGNIIPVTNLAPYQNYLNWNKRESDMILRIQLNRYRLLLWIAQRIMAPQTPCRKLPMPQTSILKLIQITIEALC